MLSFNDCIDDRLKNIINHTENGQIIWKAGIHNHRTFCNYINCYVTKTGDFNRFLNVVEIIKDFGIKIIELPYFYP